MKATHKGWFLFCPSYMNLENEEAPDLWARVRWLEPLFSVCNWMQQQFMWVMSCMNPDYEPTFAIMVTGESSVEAPDMEKHV